MKDSIDSHDEVGSAQLVSNKATLRGREWDEAIEATLSGSSIRVAENRAASQQQLLRPQHATLHRWSASLLHLMLFPLFSPSLYKQY